MQYDFHAAAVAVGGSNGVFDFDAAFGHAGSQQDGADGGSAFFGEVGVGFVVGIADDDGFFAGFDAFNHGLQHGQGVGCHVGFALGKIKLHAVAGGDHLGFRTDGVFVCQDGLGGVGGKGAAGADAMAEAGAVSGATTVSTSEGAVMPLLCSSEVAAAMLAACASLTGITLGAASDAAAGTGSATTKDCWS